MGEESESPEVEAGVPSPLSIHTYVLTSTQVLPFVWAAGFGKHKVTVE